MLEVEVFGAELRPRRARRRQRCGRLCAARGRVGGHRGRALAIEFVDAQRIAQLNARASRQSRARQTCCRSRSTAPCERGALTSTAPDPRELGDVVICPSTRATCARRSSTACCTWWVWTTRPTTARCSRCRRSCCCDAATRAVTRSGFVALAGRPNVGKSTLVNALVGEKVAIVSDRPQTTRRAIRGVRSSGDCQIVLVDLPGVQRPRDALTERMAQRVRQELEGCRRGAAGAQRRAGGGPGRPLHRAGARGRERAGDDRGEQGRSSDAGADDRGAGAGGRAGGRRGGLPDLGAHRRGRGGARRASGGG